MNLSAGFIVNQDSANLRGEFISQQAGSQELVAAFDGQVSLNLPAEFISRQAGSQNLTAEFEAGQGSRNLLGKALIRHSAEFNLAASFDGQVSLNLPAEFSARRSTQQELAASFTVNQALRDLPGEFVSRQPGSQVLLGIMNIVHFLDLGAGFKIRRSTSENLLGAVMSRQAGSQTLLAEFIVYNADAPDLLGKFKVRHEAFTGTGVIIAYNPKALLNLNVDVGTGFLSTPVIGSDKRHVVIGESSHKFRIDYLPNKHDYISFGWRYFNESLPAPRPHRDLACSFEVPHQGFKDLIAQFHVGDLIYTYSGQSDAEQQSQVAYTSVLTIVIVGVQLFDEFLLDFSAIIDVDTPGKNIKFKMTANAVQIGLAIEDYGGGLLAGNHVVSFSRRYQSLITGSLELHVEMVADAPVGTVTIRDAVLTIMQKR